MLIYFPEQKYEKTAVRMFGQLFFLSKVGARLYGKHFLNQKTESDFSESNFLIRKKLSDRSDSSFLSENRRPTIRISFFRLKSGIRLVGRLFFARKIESDFSESSYSDNDASSNRTSFVLSKPPSKSLSLICAFFTRSKKKRCLFQWKAG